MANRPPRVVLPPTFQPADLDDQIHAQLEEITRCKTNLQKLVDAKRMHQGEMDRRVELMWSIYHSLLRLEAGQGMAAMDAG